MKSKSMTHGTLVENGTETPVTVFFSGKKGHGIITGVYTRDWKESLNYLTDNEHWRGDTAIYTHSPTRR